MTTSVAGSSATAGGTSTGSSNGHGVGEDPMAVSQLSFGKENGNGVTNGDVAAHTDGKATNGVAPKADLNGSDAMDEDSSAFVPLYDGSNLDRRQFIRITLQSLRELGFESSARSLESESGVTLEHPSIVAFRKSILSGDWKHAEALLLEGLTRSATRIAEKLGRLDAIAGPSAATTPPNLELVFRDPKTHGLDSVKFLIYQQRYLELLEAKQTRKALSVLRDRLAPLNYGSHRLHLLSSLVICATPEELRARAHWLGSGQESRRKVLEDIESAILPAVMIPSRRLPQLLEQAQHLQKARDPFYNLPLNTRISLYVDHRPDKGVFPTRNLATLRDHEDEIWHVAFSNDGTRLAAAGKNKCITVWTIGVRQEDFHVLHTFGPLSGSICHVAFSPHDKRLLSTSDNGEVVAWDLSTGERQNHKAHTYTVGSASWLNGGRGFVTGGMDCKVIFWNADGKQKCLWNTYPFRVQALDVSPDGRYLVAISHRYLPSARGGGSSSALAATANPLASTSTSHTWADATTSPVLNDEEWAMARSDLDDVFDLGGGSRTLRDERFQIHFYDVRRHEEIGSIYMKDEMTSVCFSEDSRFVLINQRPNEAQLWDVERQSLSHRFTGHHIQHYVIRSCFGGAEKSFIISGSEDGAVYLYHRKTGKLLERLRGHDKGSVNSVAWHPRQHNMFASCGDDGTVRIWGPNFDEGLGRNFQDFDLSHTTDNGGDAHNGGHHATSSDMLAPAENGYELLGSGTPLTGALANIRTQDSGAYAPSTGSQEGPTPFPWATSPRAPTSPTSATFQRQSRRQAVRTAAALAGMSRRRRSLSGGAAMDEARLDDEELGNFDEDDEEEEEEEEEDDEEEDEEEEDVMEEGGD